MLPFSDEELIEPVQETLKNIMPMLEKDGGGMKFLGIKNGVVYITLIGACHGCPSSGQTLKYGIEKQLKIDIHPELTLVNIPKDEEFNIDKI